MSFLIGKSPSPQPLPPAPNIDDATRNRDELDRLRRRRGVLANIFSQGGDPSGAAASPSVGVKTLGGGQ